MAPLLIVLLALVLVGLPLWALFRILALEKKNQELERRLSQLEHELPRPPASLPAIAATPAAGRNAIEIPAPAVPRSQAAPVPQPAPPFPATPFASAPPAAPTPPPH